MIYTSNPFKVSFWHGRKIYLCIMNTFNVTQILDNTSIVIITIAMCIQSHQNAVGRQAMSANPRHSKAFPKYTKTS